MIHKVCVYCITYFHFLHGAVVVAERVSTPKPLLSPSAKAYVGCRSLILALNDQMDGGNLRESLLSVV